jgi:hypothetical protein
MLSAHAWSSAHDPFGRERPGSVLRKLVEMLLYLMVLNSVFLYKTGFILIPYLAGGLNTIAGVICLFVMLLEGERFATSVKFAIAMNITANLSQMLANGVTPILGRGLPQMLHWLSTLLIVCYLVRNTATQKRVMIFFTLLLIGVSFYAGETVGVRGGKRVGVAEDIGGNFANPNTLGYVGGFFCVAVLFWSLRCTKAFRPMLWVLAALLFFITVRTVSRVGIFLLLFGLGVLVISVLMGRGARVGGIIMIVVCLLALSQLTFVFADTIYAFEKRLHGERESTMSRLNLYSWDTLGDLAGTLFIGKGPERAESTSTGITAHNTFVYTHMCFGGITAWPYLAWLIVLGVRVVRMLRSRVYTWDTSLMIFAMYSMILGEQLTNNYGYTDFSSIYGIALIEKYAGPFDSRQVVDQLRSDFGLVPRGRLAYA